MKQVKCSWKRLGYSHGPLENLKRNMEMSFGAFFTVQDEIVSIGFVVYLGKIYVSFWWLR